MQIRFLRHNLPTPFLVLAIVEGLVFLAAPYAVASWLAVPPSWASPDGADTFQHALLFATTGLLCMVAVGLYNPGQRFAFAGQMARVVAGMAATVILLVVVFYLFPALTLARRVLLLSVLAATLALMPVRLVFTRVLDNDRLKRKILVYGAGQQASHVAALRRRSDQRGFHLIGYVAANGVRDPQVPEDRILVPRGSLHDLCVEHAIDEIVVAMDDRRQQFPMNDLLECRLDGIEVVELVTFLERETGKVNLDALNPSWMIFSDGFERGRVHATLENICDVVASLVLLAVGWPLMLLTALAIKLEDGPRATVLYRQQRVGQYGRPFSLLKFRSMCEDAEQDGKARWAEDGDGRLTRVGALIRKVRIDEMPQLLNVLKGEMSLVGPRPERPEFVLDLQREIPFYRERHNLKPGITGWAQLCYRYGSSEADAREKLQYDLYYVKNHTLLFYLVILLQTVEVVVSGKGAR